MNRLKSWYKRYRYQKAMKSIRGTMLFFGHDLSDLTDEEIEQGASKVHEVISNAGVTTNEAYTALIYLAKMLRKERG